MRLMVSRATWMYSTLACVVISPASTTSPVVHSVSAATRLFGSWANMASSTASEIWSDTLSGCPSETDSDVHRNSLFIWELPHGRTAGYFNKDDPPAVLHLKSLLRPLASLSLAANHAVGAFLGRLAFLLSPRYRKRLLENLGGSGLAATGADLRRMARENAAEIGKG